MEPTNYKLNQVVAIEKGTKSRSHALITEAYQTAQKSALFNGFTKRYTPQDAENGIKKPDEGTKAQFKVDDLLTQVAQSMSELFDVTLTKDSGNCAAFANVVVDGKVLVTQAPVTYLLFLEKKLTDIHTFVKKLPTLDAAEPWKGSPNADGLCETEAYETQSIENYEEPVVVVQATEKFPAQVQIAKKQRVVGNWRTIKSSGALPATRVKVLTERVEKLMRAVKLARESANMTEVPTKTCGADVFAYLFS